MVELDLLQASLRRLDVCAVAFKIDKLMIVGTDHLLKQEYAPPELNINCYYLEIRGVRI